MPGERVTSISGVRPPAWSFAGSTLLVVGTLSGLPASIAPISKSCRCLAKPAGESWQRAHFVSMPRKAAVMIVPFVA